MKTIGYDGQAFLFETGGGGKGGHLRTLIGPFEEQFVGFASTEPNRTGHRLIQEGWKGHTLWQQLSLPASLLRHRVHAFLAPANTAPVLLSRKIRLILVLHDTILLHGYRHPKLRGRLQDQYRRWLIPRSVRRAQIILTVSEHARQDILTRFGPRDVRVIPCTVPEAWFAPRPIAERPAGRDGYVLMVTSNAPHKNAPGAFEAYARYVRMTGEEACRLHVVGMRASAAAHLPRLKELGIDEHVQFLPFLSEEELRSAYQGAQALLFPSFAEGFGVPMLEAMATGTPVIAADATSLPEVGGDAAVYFDPRQPGMLAETLCAVLGDAAWREQMAARGLVRVQTYAPERVRAAVIAFWQEAAGGPITEAPVTEPVPATEDAPREPAGAAV